MSKSFEGNQNPAVKDASMNIPEYGLFGLIGPDGAGKTTLFRMITTLLTPDKGELLIFGLSTLKDYRKIRKFTGYMPGRFSLYPDLTVEENLQFYATIFGTTIGENFHLIRPVYSLLEPFKKRFAKDLSGGMKQKLALSCALIHKPRLLVLDEPTTGVDAVSRKEFWENLRILKDSGMTIIVSTPYMDEAAQCDLIALMQGGVIMEFDTPGAVLDKYHRTLLEVEVIDKFGLLNEVRKMDEVVSAYLFGDSIHVTMKTTGFQGDGLAKKVHELGFQDAKVRPISPDMEDCFIEAVDRTVNSERRY